MKTAATTIALVAILLFSAVSTAGAASNALAAPAVRAPHPRLYAHPDPRLRLHSDPRLRIHSDPRIWVRPFPRLFGRPAC